MLADTPAIAHLVVQLVDSPFSGGVLGGESPAALERLVRFTLEANGGQGVAGFTVACDGYDVIGCAALKLPGRARPVAASGVPPPESPSPLPSGRVIFRVVVAMFREGIALVRPRLGDRDAPAWLHSLIVDARFRGRGAGSALLAEMENRAVAAGCRSISLQVLAANDTAFRLYSRAGYRAVRATPWWLRRLAIPSYLMHKDLSPRTGEGAE